MAVLANRRDAGPIVIRPGGALSRPARIPFTERKLGEGLLHKLIESNPDVLPISEIEPAFSPSITVGYEVPTKSGSIDLLLLSPQGYLTIVETKLWRNPEARREVVGQIVEYAKDVSQWSFEELDNKVREYNRNRHKRNDGVMASLKKLDRIDETEEATITDTIARNLRNGQFLLLVVGDGIRESVEAMADYLQQTPQLHFTLALVELQVYELDDEGKGARLVIPQVVARTKEITRAVVRIEGKGIDSVKVDVGTEITRRGEAQERFIITEEAFRSALGQSADPIEVDFTDRLMKDMETLGCTINWKQASFVVTLRDPGGSGQKLSLLIIYKNGHVQLSELASQLRSIGLSDQIAYDYAKESAQLLGHELKTENPMYWRKPVTLGELRAKYEQFVSIVRKTIDRIGQAAINGSRARK